MYRIILFGAIALIALPATAQMTRERAAPSGPVDELFWAPTVIGTASVTNVPKGNVNFTIMHVFGQVSQGVENLFGLDGGANIRFGIDVGVSDRLSVGLGRSRIEKVYDMRAKVNLMRQSRDGRSPVEIAVNGGVGVTTERNGWSFSDRLSYVGTVMVARRVSEQLSIQVSPMWSHFNTVVMVSGPDGNPVVPQNDHLAVAVAARWVLSPRVALTAEFIPVVGDRSDGTRNALGLGVDLETGGHVFQLFVTSSPWLIEQYTVSRNSDDFLSGDFRIGFNVNRVFGLGK